MANEEEKSADGISIVNQQFEPGRTALFEVIDGVEGSGKKLQIENKVIPAPLPTLDRPRAPHHKFMDLDAFAQYLNRYGEGSDVVVLGDEYGTVNATLKELEDDHAHTVVSYTPVETSLLRFVKQLNGRRLNLKAFIRTIRRLREHIQRPDADSLRLLMGQIKVARKFEKYDGVSSRHTFGEILKIELKGGQDQQIDLPSELVVRLLPFLDSEDQDENYITVLIDVEVEVDDQGRPQFSLTCDNMEDALHDARQKVMANLAVLIDPLDAVIGLGTIEYVKRPTI